MDKIRLHWWRLRPFRAELDSSWPESKSRHKQNKALHGQRVKPFRNRIRPFKGKIKHLIGRELLHGWSNGAVFLHIDGGAQISCPNSS